MSAGGINARPSLASYAAPVSGAPVAGQQAGSVAPAGGDVNIPRTVAIAAGVGGEAMQQRSAVAAAQQQVAGQQVVDPSMAQPGAAAAAVGRGPAAWSEEWATKFREAGAPAEVIQQLTFTGAMGADAAQLQQMLDQIKGEIDTQLAQFAHEHPEAFKKLRGNKDVDRSMVAQIAAASNAGQLPEDQLEQIVDSIGKSQGKMLFDMFVKPMIVWSLIPGWGALRIGFAPFTGGKDILTGEKMFGDPMSTAFTIMAGIGGGMTIYNNVRGAMQVAQGHRMIGQAGSDAAQIAAREGLDNLGTAKKLWSFVPGTELNQQVAGLSRLDDIKAGIGNLKGIQQEIAQNFYNKIVAGDVQIFGDSASKWTKMGYQPNQRGFLMGHIMGKKGATSIVNNGSRPTYLLDGRTTGQNVAAHMAADGAQFVDDTVGNNFLKSRVFSGLDPSDANVIKNLHDLHLGKAGEQLLGAGAISRPTGVNKILSAMRPGALDDTIWAVDNLAAGTLGKAHGWAAIPRFAKWGLGGALAAAGGYFMMIKPQQDAKKEAEKQQAEAQAQAAQQQGGGSIDPSQLSQEDLAVLQQFAAMPAEQQAQIIQNQYAQLQQAMQTPNMTPEMQQQVAAAQAELQLLMQVSQGGLGAVGGAAAGTGQPMAAAPTPGAGAASGNATGMGQPQFTAQGLGLAG